MNVDDPSGTTRSAGRPAALLAALAIAVLPLSAAAGCGGGNDTSKAAQQTIDRTFGQPHDYRSGVLDARLGVATGDSKAAALSLALAGPWQSTGKGGVPAFQQDVVLGTGGNTISVKLTSDGNAAWVDFAGLTYRLPDSVFGAFEQAWTGGTASAGAGKGGSLLSRLGFDPADWISDPEVAGDERVGGAETVHVRAKVDVSSLADDLGAILAAANAAGGGLLQVPQINDDLRKQLEGSVERADFDLWSGKQDGAIRKLAVNVVTKKSGALPQAAITFEVTLTDLGTPQRIAVPKDSKGFGGLTGVLSGLASALTGGEAGVPAAYSKCIDAAKTAEAVAACTTELIK